MFDTLSWHAMNATADDWESLDQILPQVREFCGNVDRRVIAELIATLVKQGLMEEMKGRLVQPEDVLADSIEYWFRMTPAGRLMWDEECKRHRWGEV
jgi:hypothetical protein